MYSRGQCAVKTSRAMRAPATLPWRMLSFRLGPFPVTVYPQFFLGAVLLGSQYGLGWRMLVWVAVVFVSILFHELGHAIVGRSLGGSPEIRLEMLGGVTYPQLRKRPTPLRQFVLSVAGPLFGLALGGLAWGMTVFMPPAPGSWSAVAMGFILYTSVVWAVFNLLPILPLDGGQMMLAVLEGVRRKPSETLASWVSVAVSLAAALGVYLLLGFQPWMLLWFGFFAFQNFTRAKAARSAGPQAFGAPAVDPLEQVQIARSTEEARSAVAARDFEAALKAATALEAAGGPLRQAAGLRLRAGIELARGDNETSALLAGQSFSIVQNAESAVVAARANLRAGQKERALNWLRRAVEAGAAPAAIRADPELSALT
jgi:Zn-dependent protease